jgi:hypothetical protein
MELEMIRFILEKSKEGCYAKERKENRKISAERTCFLQTVLSAV